MLDLFRPHGTAGVGDDPLVITPEGAGWTYCGLRVFRLAPGESRTFASGGAEMAVLPLSGSATVEVESYRFDLRGRPDVFSRVSDFAYVPFDAEVRVSSAGGGEFALPAAEASRRFDPAYGPAEEVAVEIRGAGRATRQVINFLNPEAFPADTLIAVEVITPGGNTSSYPPHKHDETSEVESRLEEIYYFRIKGEGGFGIHRTYTADGALDVTVTVRDGDVFLIPRGYHGPCFAAPDFHMYYLNVMGGPERVWRFTDDPDYARVREGWAGQPADPRLPLFTAEGPRP